MDFEEIKRQSTIAAEKQEVIDTIKRNNGNLVCGISIEHEICEGSVKTYRVKSNSKLWRDILSLVKEGLEQENEQTAHNLHSWVKI